MSETLSDEVSTGPSLAFGVTLSSAPAAASAIGTGASIDRYVLLSELGAGAMGVVYAAYDPVLDRKIALKLLGLASEASAGARLQREAQALAKLEHPNVVTVHDVGTHAGRLFISMEFVEGQTLGDWIRAGEGPRPWPEVVRVFSEAGRGLAAAHEAGLVHRDFKPDNVMLGDDGRARVMDFGLARAQLDGGDEGAGDEDADTERSAEERMLDTVRQSSESPQILGEHLTRTGALMGTPAYMSPEQLEGRPADARSDQFSFCVALHEALYGQRPFTAKTLTELRSVLDAGQIADPPRGAAVPSWLRKVVVRGLAPVAEQRWPSLEALLAALADDPALRRRKWWTAGLGIGLLGLGVVGLPYLAPDDADPTCVGFEDRLAGVWDPDRRAAASEAILATQLSYAPATWERVERLLDDYSARWVEAREDACELTQRGEQSGELLDLRMACLDERLEHLHATVEVLTRADETVVEEAVQALTSLPTLDRCADIDALRTTIPRPEAPAIAERVEAQERALIEARALEQAGKYADALTLTDAIVVEAEVLGYEPLQVRAWLRQGSLRQARGAYEAAERAFEQAYDAALGLGMKHEAAEAAAGLVRVVGQHLARYDEGLRWAQDARPLARAAGTAEAQARYLDSLGEVERDQGEHALAREHHEAALAQLERALGPDDSRLADSLNNLGAVTLLMGDYERSLDYFERALTLTERTLGADHPQVGATLHNLGKVLQKMGNYEDARRHRLRALDINERALGPDHPDVAMTLTNLGNAAVALGQYEDALAYQTRALAISERAFGPDHPQVSVALTNLANVLQGEGKIAEARRHRERALAIAERALGPDHPRIATVLTNLGNLAYYEDKLDEARSYQERALAINEDQLGPEHPDVGLALVNLASVVSEQGDQDAAFADYERARTIFAAKLGPAHPMLAYPLMGLARVSVERGQPVEALDYAERALAIWEASQAAPMNLALTHFVLARALWDAPADQGRDRARARALAEGALAVLEREGEAGYKSVGEVERWLASHVLRARP